MAYSNFRNGFNISTSAAIDRRILLSKAEMLTAEDVYNLPDVYLALCPDDGKLYLYNVNNSIDPVTGKYRVFDGLGDKIVIQDPTNNQVLFYNEEIGKWINKDLSDGESIIYLDERGLTIKGYDEAHQGDMLVKDNTHGIAWRSVDAEIAPYVAQAQAAATNASTSASSASQSALIAGNAASDASESASRAEGAIVEVKDYVEKKFWWGSLAEYNALEQIDEGTFYFIKPGV